MVTKWSYGWGSPQHQELHQRVPASGRLRTTALVLQPWATMLGLLRVLKAVRQERSLHGSSETIQEFTRVLLHLPLGEAQRLRGVCGSQMFKSRLTAGCRFVFSIPCIYNRYMSAKGVSKSRPVVALFSQLEGRWEVKQGEIVFPFYLSLKIQITVNSFSSNYSTTLKYMKQNSQTKVLKYLTTTMTKTKTKKKTVIPRGGDKNQGNLK